MDFYFKSTRNCVSYGSIISFMSDVVDNNPAPLINYDPVNPSTHEFEYKKEDFVDFFKNKKDILILCFWSCHQANMIQ